MKHHGLSPVALAVKDVRRSLAFYQKVLGVVHFGFRLVKPVPVATIDRRVRSAGGKVLSKGEFAPGLPYVFFEDPDGYEVEVWYETPTPVDPKRARKRG